MNAVTLGVDMAKRTFAAALWFGGHRCPRANFDNTPAGFRKLARWLKAHGVGVVRAGVESTNVFADALLEWLYAAGHCVYLLNPERTACFARSRGQRNKTDPADAVTIAMFVAQHQGTPWQPPPPEQKSLRELTRTRHQLVAIATQLSNQIRTTGAAGRGALKAALEAVRQQILNLVRQIKAHLKGSPALAEQVRRIMTIKGIALVTAATVIAELPPITPQTDPRTICGWAGLTPRRWQSGLSEWRSRLTRKGNTHLRDALYMPALVAKRFNPVFAAFAERLTAKGKTNPQILGAISHKMLRIAVGLLRSNTDFNPNWNYEKI